MNNSVSNNALEEYATCRICFKRDGAMVSPCNCRGTMAHVHDVCLRRWLDTRLTYECDVCHFPVQQSLRLKSVGAMVRHVFRICRKLLVHGKMTILKALFYFAYIFFSIRSGIACFRILVKQLRHKFGLTFQTILSVLYLAYISAQLFEFSAN